MSPPLRQPYGEELVQVAELQVVSQVVALTLPPLVDVAENVGRDEKYLATLPAAVHQAR